MAGSVIENGVPDFFERIAALPVGAAAVRAFDRILRAGDASSLPGWQNRLYRRLIFFLLREFTLPHSPGAERWEWAPLFRLEQELDPHYFGQRELSERLAACPAMPPETRAALAGILERYLAWRREPLRVVSPYPLLSSGETLRWAAIFPKQLAWASFDVLRETGLYPLAGAGGYRAWRRFTRGEFDPPLSPESLAEWGEACRHPSLHTESQRRDFLAGAFAGEWPALGLQGPCGSVPHCEVCPLSGACLWANGGMAEPATAAEALARIRREGAPAAPTERLLQALFGLDTAQSREWRERTGRTPIRKLAELSLQDLESWLAGLAPEPERLLALFELARRFSEERLLPGAVFRGGEDVYKHFRVRLRDAKQEHFFLLLLDTRRRFQGEVAVSQGTIERALIHPRDVFGAAVRERAGAVVVVHNHPSGDPTPSPEDINVTRRLSEAGALLGIPLLDHVIVGEGRYLSFAEQGLLGKA